MEWISHFLIQQPLHILGVAAALGILWGVIKPRVRSMLVAALTWLGYAVWEWVVLLHTPEANIRMDLLLLWPLLAILTIWALSKLGFTQVTRRKTRE